MGTACIVEISEDIFLNTERCWQGQRPQYAGPVQSPQYNPGMPGQNPQQYPGQHMQPGAGQFANPTPVQGGQYGGQGMPRQGLNQLSSQMQAQYAPGGQAAGAYLPQPCLAGWN